MIIPPDFAAQVSARQAQVLLLLDGSDSYTTNTAYNMANALSQSYAISLIRQTVNPLDLSTRILYNLSRLSSFGCPFKGAWRSSAGALLFRAGGGGGAGRLLVWRVLLGQPGALLWAVHPLYYIEPRLGAAHLQPCTAPTASAANGADDDDV